MTKEEIAAHLTNAGVVPVIAMESIDDALPLADALIAGGLPVVEITFRTAAAAEIIALLRAERPGLLVGAGTVLTPENATAAHHAGAAFAVAPGLNPEVVAHARSLGLPFFPGVATPSDIERGLALGCTFLKFFPAEALGGTAMLAALSAPYAHRQVQFMPTGGVTPANLAPYLKLPTVAAAGGTWIAKQADMAQGDWPGIARRCAEAVALVQQVREA